MQVLFIGGTGVISSACSKLAIERGIDLYLLNRGESKRATPNGAKILRGDIRNIESVRRALGNQQFDAVVDWIVFTPEQVNQDVELFRDRTAQYVFISSASVYQTPPASLPVTESTPLDNPYWDYSRDKIACERALMQAYADEKFPVTIVRPSHTYDETMLPLHGGYTMVDRMRRSKKIIAHGDGTSLWALTHHRDFAKGFVGLLGNSHAIGDAFHITSDEILTWNQIYEIIAQAAGTQAQIVHVASDYIAMFDKTWGDGLLGDKAHSMIFDNSKIKRIVPDFVASIPFSIGARESMAWFDADSARRAIDTKLDQTIDHILAAYEAGMPPKK